MGGDRGYASSIEMQEGALRMARKKYCEEHQATTACTLRMVEGVYSNDGKKRTVYADSWFTGVETQQALEDKFKYHIIGAVKTSHANFPAEALRWTLVGTERGDRQSHFQSRQ